MNKKYQQPITLAVVCYNFEKFVREAIESALAQTYSPLSILISDDCSTDRTFDIIQETVANYKGSHKIVLNQNPVNLGLARHENKIFELADTEWIIFQSGDDISYPQRVQRVADLIRENPDLRCVHSQCEIIAEDGSELKIPKAFIKRSKVRFQASRPPSILGAGAVYHSDVYTVFGPLAPQVANEDHVLPLRAALLGEVVYIDEPLVKYRKHTKNHSSNFSLNKTVAAQYRKHLTHSHLQSLMDLQLYENTVPAQFGKVQKLRKQVEDELYVAWFLGNWHLYPKYRVMLLKELLFSTRLMSLFFRRIIMRGLRAFF